MDFEQGSPALFRIRPYPQEVGILSERDLVRENVPESVQRLTIPGPSSRKFPRLPLRPFMDVMRLKPWPELSVDLLDRLLVIDVDDLVIREPGLTVFSHPAIDNLAAGGIDLL